MAHIATDSTFIDREAAAVASKGWLERLFDAMIESRQRAANREIAKFEHFSSETARVMKGVSSETLPFKG